MNRINVRGIELRPDSESLTSVAAGWGDVRGCAMGRKVQRDWVGWKRELAAKVGATAEIERSSVQGGGVGLRSRRQGRCRGSGNRSSGSPVGRDGRRRFGVKWTDIEAAKSSRTLSVACPFPRVKSRGPIETALKDWRMSASLASEPPQLNGVIASVGPPYPVGIVDQHGLLKEIEDVPSESPLAKPSGRHALAFASVNNVPQALACPSKSPGARSIPSSRRIDRNSIR